MSVLQYQVSMSDDITDDVQIWNNAAFDNGDTVVKDSFSSMQSVSGDGSEFDSEFGLSKENYCPDLCTSPVCLRSPMNVKPLCVNNGNVKSQGKPLKVLFKQGLLDPMPSVCDNGGEVVRDDSKIDEEMEEIEKEVSRLLLKLGSLRLEKEARDVKPLCTPKVVEQKETSKVSFMPRKIEGSPVVRNGVRSNLRGVSIGPLEIAAGGARLQRKQEITPIPSGKNRRGISLGPLEIASGVRSQRGKQEVTPIQPVKNRRGISLGPSEIIAGTRSQQRGKQELPPIQSAQNSRRKSCFYKLQEVDEGKVLKARGGRSLSLSPQSRLAQSKIQASKQRFMTTEYNKTVKKDDRVLFGVRPKNLFKEGEQSSFSKRPIKSGRVVASRYSQIPAQCSGNQTQNDRRKMSLPGNDKCDKKRSSVGKTCIFSFFTVAVEIVTIVRVKKI
ncbi:hypothetical protein IFM89_035061 [Coptis chinensis]|uniref:Uncharacterized protein n=1 Tax=Coptis chinensis TaxID=261450 RepID=A0A835H9I8_9MAGN|nr:hypothetical protein IFM89_035061 [Coptis chinensis]